MGIRREGGKMMRYDKYERLGAIHHEWYKTESWYKELIDFALDNVFGNRVLDIGCGDGLFLSLCEKKGLQTFGLDDNKSGLDLARGSCPKTVFYPIDISTYDKEIKQRFDTVTCVNTIEHLEKPQQVIRLWEELGTKLIIITNYPRENKGRYHYQELEPEDWIKVLGLHRYNYFITPLNDHFAIEVYQ